MGRPKAYDAEETLELARALFHEQGFAATSMADLVERMGINRKSLYAEFGSKQALFESALRLYGEVAIEREFGPLEVPGAGVAEIEELLEKFGVGGRGPSAGLGCLLCNTASERAAFDPESREHVDAWIVRMTSAFRRALAGGRVDGDIASTVDIDVEARFFASHFVGQLTLIRANVAPEVVESASVVASRHLAQLSAPTDPVHPRSKGDE